MNAIEKRIHQALREAGFTYSYQLEFVLSPSKIPTVDTTFPILEVNRIMIDDNRLLMGRTNQNMAGVRRMFSHQNDEWLGETPIPFLVSKRQSKSVMFEIKYTNVKRGRSLDCRVTATTASGRVYFLNAHIDITGGDKVPRMDDFEHLVSDIKRGNLGIKIVKQKGKYFRDIQIERDVDIYNGNRIELGNEAWDSRGDFNKYIVKRK